MDFTFITNLAGIEHSWQDYPTPHNCITAYFTGCDFDCPDCHNKSLQVHGSGPISVSIEELINMLSKKASAWKTKCITLMGGDPFHPANRDITKLIVLDEKYKKSFDFCIYTGYSFSQVKEYLDGRESEVPFIKCGTFKKIMFQEPYKTDEVFQLASKNQELYHFGSLVSENGTWIHNPIEID